MYVLALYLEEVCGYDAFTAGLLLLPSTVSILAFIMVGARLELRRGPRYPLTVGFFIMGVGTFLVGFLTPETAYWWFATGLFIQGIGIGLYSTPLSDVAVGLAPPDEAGAASGAFKMCSMVGGAFGVAVFGGVYRAIQTSTLKASAAAADLTSAQQQQVSDAFSSSEKAKQIYDSLSKDVQAKVLDEVHRALSKGIGSSLKLAACLAVVAVVVTLLLVPKGSCTRTGRPGRADARRPAGRRDSAGPRAGDRYPRPTTLSYTVRPLAGHARRARGEVSELA